MIAGWLPSSVPSVPATARRASSRLVAQLPIAGWGTGAGRRKEGPAARPLLKVLVPPAQLDEPGLRVSPRWGTGLCLQTNLLRGQLDLAVEVADGDVGRPSPAGRSEPSFRFPFPDSRIPESEEVPMSVFSETWSECQAESLLRAARSLSVTLNTPSFLLSRTIEVTSIGLPSSCLRVPNPGIQKYSCLPRRARRGGIIRVEGGPNGQTLACSSWTRVR